MKISLSSRIEFGQRADKPVTTFTLSPETPEEKALIQALYGLKGTVRTCSPFIEVSFTRRVEF